MVNNGAIRNVVGIIGNIIAFGLFLSPLPTFVTIVQNKAVKQFSPYPYLATLLNCLLWCLYGLPVVHPHSVLVLTINGAGIVFEVIYLSIFLYYAPNKTKLKVLAIIAGELLFVGAVAAAVLNVAHTHEKRSMMVGIFCVIFGTLMYASPLSVIRLVIRSKSVEYMPFTLSLFSFINAVCWTTYALLKFDIFITIPNGIGIVLGLVQLGIYLAYFEFAPKVKESARAVQVEEV